MAKAKECLHRRWTVTNRAAVTEHPGSDEPRPDPRRRYRVLEVVKCVKCETTETRWSRFYGATERSALKRAGVPADDLPDPPKHKAKPPITVAAAGWPFPCSAHVEPGSSPAQP